MTIRPLSHGHARLAFSSHFIPANDLIGASKREREPGPRFDTLLAAKRHCVKCAHYALHVHTPGARKTQKKRATRAQFGKGPCFYPISKRFPVECHSPNRERRRTCRKSDSFACCSTRLHLHERLTLLECAKETMLRRANSQRELFNRAAAFIDSRKLVI